MSCLPIHSSVIGHNDKFIGLGLYRHVNSTEAADEVLNALIIR